MHESVHEENAKLFIPFFELRNNLSLTECALRWRHKTRLRAKSAAIWKIAEFAWFCDKFSDRRILEGLSDTHWTDQIQRKSCVHLYYSPLSLTAATHASSNAHTHTGISGPRPIRGGVRPSLSLIGLDHDISLTGVSFVEPQSFWVADTFFFFSRMAGRTSAPWDFC